MSDKRAEIARLKQLIALGTQLGYMDDVAHHIEELKKVRNG